MKIDFKRAKSFLAIGETSQKTAFKRYVGVGESYPIALNPSKKELEEIYGRELNYEPEYFGTDEETGTKWAKLDFIVKTKPEVCNGAEIISNATFIIRNEQYFDSTKTKVRVIDAFGNSVWMQKEDADNGKPALNRDGNPSKIGKYRIARKGEPELCDFLRKFINVPDAFDYANGIWTQKKLKHASELSKEEAEKGNVLTFEQCSIALDNSDFDSFYKGDVKGLWDVIKNRMSTNATLGIVLLYGVKTKDDGKQSQVVCTGYDMMLHRNPNAKALGRLEKNLSSAKASNMYGNIDFRVQELQEYTVEPTNLDKPAEDSGSSSDMPWDN